ncbi:hypothetical protein MMC18_007956 [Xylographa bjoerkii]|nr:hypothetical protein [Xylographa bjoerkii]
MGNVVKPSFACKAHASNGDTIESVAIVGFSLTFPEDATSAEAFWSMLTEGRCASADFPKNRMNVDAFYDPSKDGEGSIPLRGGHFIRDDFAAFDAPFFSITAAEAAAMDPLQRNLLEVSYRALESAGIPMTSILGSNTSVHTGCFNTDFLSLISKDPERMPKYTGTGAAASMLSNRLSWFYDLKGPNMTISLSNLGFLSHDSKCYSFDQRANGYARGEGIGVVILKRVVDAVRDNDTIRAVIRSTGTNQDGRTPGITLPNIDSQVELMTETYHKADLDMKMTRYIESHGTGTPVGDPLEARAIGIAFLPRRKDEEPLYVGAVKANIGHLEGASGIAGLIKTTLVLENGIIPRNANFECLNSQIDSEFLNIKFPSENLTWPTNGPRRGSINSFGFGGTNSHAVVDDAYHYLRARNLPGNHYTVQQPSLPKDQRPNSNQRPLAFHHELDNGYSHLQPVQVSEDLIVSITNRQRSGASIPKLLIWSAADEGGISRLCTQFREYFRRISLDNTNEDNYLKSLAYTLNTRRTSLAWKSFAVTDSLAQLEKLEDILSKPIRSSPNPKLTYIFTGQGAQWHAMGRELLLYSVFKSSLQDANNYFKRIGCEWLVLEELLKDEDVSIVNSPKLSQPLCTVLQIALVDLLSSVGIHPSSVVGHSSGEIAAAYCVGAISRQSAWRIAYYRGLLAFNLAHRSPTKHTMVSVGLSEDASGPYLKRVTQHYAGLELTLSCINSPQNVTISGTEAQVDCVIRMLKQDGIFARKLQVSVAYHSPQMNEIAGEYLKHIGELEKGQRPAENIVFVSSLTGQATGTHILSKGEYWVQNMLAPVRFKEALEKVCSQSSQSFSKKLDRSHHDFITTDDILEIGPHSALRGPVREILLNIDKDHDVSYCPTIVRKRSALTTFLEAVGRLHCRGYVVDLAHTNIPNLNHSGPMLVMPGLPEYPFDHSQIYWEESRLSKGHRFRQHPRVDILGTRVPDWNPMEGRWRNMLKASDIPWVLHHQVNGSILLPAAGMLVMVIEAAKQMCEDQSISGYEMKDATFSTPLNMSLNPDGIETELYLRPLRGASDKNNAWSEFRLCIYENEKWAESCRGVVQLKYDQSKSTEVDEGAEEEKLARYFKEQYHTVSRSCNKVADTRYVYQRLQEFGLDYGSNFQVLQQLRYNDNIEATGELIASRPAINPSPTVRKPYVIHPTTLDGLLQLTFVGLTKGGTYQIPTLVASRINRLWVASSEASTNEQNCLVTYAKTVRKGYRVVESSMWALNASDKQLQIQIEGFEATAVTQVTPQTKSEAKQVFYNIDWKPDLGMLDRQQTEGFCNRSCTSEPDPKKFYQDLAFLLYYFISNTLEELKEFDCQIPHLHRYFSWMQIQLEAYKAGTLQESQPEWKHYLQDPAHVKTLSQSIARHSKQGELYVNIGQNLIKILSGTVDPLQLLFGSGLAKDFYEDLNESSQCFNQFGLYLDALAHKNPGMKFLEVGAGTGATTKIIHNILVSHGDHEPGAPRYSRYDFTDLSVSFFENAQETFGGYDRMKFAALDIEKDPFGQGFDNESYDIIIAANVLHATRDLTSTLRNIRKLLKSDGKLVLVEVVRPDLLRAGFAFGLLPGWWLSTEDYRSSGPCITEKQWHDVLLKTGFSGVDIEFRDFESDLCHGFSIMASTATFVSPSPTTLPGTVLVTNAEPGIEAGLAFQLKIQLETLGSPECRLLSLEEAASLTNIPELAFVLLEEVGYLGLNIIKSHDFRNLKTLLLSSKAVLWVTLSGESPMSATYGMVQGLSRVLRTENLNLNLVTLALEFNNDCVDRHVQHVCKVFKSMFLGSSNSREPEYVEAEGVLLIDRVVEANYLNHEVFNKKSQHLHHQKLKDAPPVQLTIETPGLLDTFRFIEDTSIAEPLAPGEIEVEMKAIGVNFLDCLVALGRVEAKTLGSEGSGVVSRVGENCRHKPGDRVSILSLDVFRTYARTRDSNAIKVADGTSFIDAAAVPAGFTTVYYGLCEVARIQEGETILIHAGAGATGQVAIQIAMHFGAIVFVTVGSNEKKRLLMDLYGIAESHILYSRDLSFAQGIKRLTGGRGVDVVLNSLAGEGLIASWECIAPYGRFIEIGKKEIHSHAKLPMNPFAANVSFSAVDLAFETHNRPPIIQRSFEKAMALFAAGTIRPAHPLRLYSVSDVEQVFRYLQSGKNSGKAVIEIDSEAQISMILDPKPTYHFPQDATYVIAGGLGGLGRSIARWMVSRGARHLILLSRSGPSGETSETLLKELLSKGARVESPICDVSDSRSLEKVLNALETAMPPIKGCIQGSMVLKDATFGTMSFDDWQACIAPKVQGSWNLHKLLPKGLDFFVLLSSACGVFGNGGQANYAAGNAYQDALARHRIAHGEQAAALDIGALLSEGFLAENDSSLNRSIRSGILPPMTAAEFLALLDYHCNPSLPISKPLHCQAMTGIENPATIRAKGVDEPYWMQQPLFRHLYQIDSTAQPGSSLATEQAVDVTEAFKAASSLAAAGAVVADALVHKLAKILGIPREDINTARPVESYGVDSLVAVELRNWFAKTLAAEVAIFEILGAPSIAAIGTVAAGKSQWKQTAWTE